MSPSLIIIIALLLLALSLHLTAPFAYAVDAADFFSGSSSGRSRQQILNQGGQDHGGHPSIGNSINPMEFFTGARPRPKIEVLYPLNGQILDSESVDIKVKLYGHDFQRDSDSNSDKNSNPNPSNVAHDINKASASVPYSSFSSNFHSSAICIGISNGSNYFEQCFFELSYLVFSVTGLIPGDHYSLRVVYYERGNAIAVSVRNFKVGFISMDLLSGNTLVGGAEGSKSNSDTDDGSVKKKLSIKSALQIAFQTQFRDAFAIDSPASQSSSQLSQSPAQAQAQAPISATTSSSSFSSSSSSSSRHVVEAILSQVPGHPEALHYYSLLLLLQGDADLAREMVSKAIKNINEKDEHNDGGANDNSKDATQNGHRAAIDTNSEEYKLSMIKGYSHSKDPRAIVDYLNTLGQCYRVLSKFEESEQTFLSAVTLHNNIRQMNILSYNLNSYDENHHVAVNNSILFNLALLYKQFNYFENAINIYNTILNSPSVANNNEDKIIRQSSTVSLCDLMTTFTSGQQSLSCFQKASVLYPHDKLIWNELGVNYARQGLFDEAIASFTTSANLNSTIASINIAHILEILGYHNDSYTRYKLILDSLNAIGNGLPTFHIKVRMAMVMPRILPSNAQEVLTIRSRIDSELTMLLDSSIDRYKNDTVIDNSQPLSFGYSMGYHLIYHSSGFNTTSNKNLKMKLSLVYLRLCPSLTSGYYMDKFSQSDYARYQEIANSMVATNAIGPGDAEEADLREDIPTTIHIGVVSRYFYSHPTGITSLGLLNELSALCRKKDNAADRSGQKKGHNFVVTVFSLNSFEFVKNDPIWRHIMSLNVNVVYLLQNIELSGNIIKSHKLDMVIFPEVNSDPITYFLSHMEISPSIVTALWWIYPETSGVPTIDYFMGPYSVEDFVEENDSSSRNFHSSIDNEIQSKSSSLDRFFIDDINFCEKVVKLPALGAAFTDVLKLLDPVGSNGGDGRADTASSTSSAISLLVANNGGGGGGGGLNLFGRNLLLERLKFTEKLKLPKLAHIYLLLAPLHYYHPDYDALIRLLLQRDKLGYVVIMDASITRPSWQRMFSRRVVGELPLDTQNRFLFYYPSNNENRLLFIAIAHVVLDIPSGLCAHCTLTALSLGTPVVTSLLPSLASNNGKSRAGGFKMGSLTLLMYQKLDPNVFKNIDSYWESNHTAKATSASGHTEHVIMAGDSSRGSTNSSSDFPCVGIDGDSNYCENRDQSPSFSSFTSSAAVSSTANTQRPLKDAVISEIVSTVMSKSCEDMVINAIKIAHKPKLRDSISLFINERRENLFATASLLNRRQRDSIESSQVNIYETLIPEMIRRKRDLKSN